MKVGYKFCGSCNPLIDTKATLEAIRRADVENEYIHWSEGGFDVLLTVSGCQRSCAARNVCGGRRVSVAGRSVDLDAAPSIDETVKLALKKLGEIR